MTDISIQFMCVWSIFHLYCCVFLLLLLWHDRLQIWSVWMLKHSRQATVIFISVTLEFHRCARAHRTFIQKRLLHGQNKMLRNYDRYGIFIRRFEGYLINLRAISTGINNSDIWGAVCSLKKHYFHKHAHEK